ncbi:MAG: hypothetical protein CMJ59_17270 [Planctomycetaceae bacterium]|nr:hypothetical protein [Planctomycetaceae bacterium]
MPRTVYAALSVGARLLACFLISPSPAQSQPCRTCEPARPFYSTHDAGRTHLATAIDDGRTLCRCRVRRVTLQNRPSEVRIFRIVRVAAAGSGDYHQKQPTGRPESWRRRFTN